MDDSRSNRRAQTPRHIGRAVKRIGGTLALALAVFCVVGAPASANAKPPLIRTWVQGHGTLLSGGTNYFRAGNPPLLGYGAQVGVAVLYFEAYYDLNVFDLGRESDERTATMWNELGAGLNFPFAIVDKVEAFIRLDASWLRAPYTGTLGSERTSGFATRGGAGIEFMPVKVIGIGGAVYGGYHLLGLRSNGDNGSHVMAQIFTRFRLRI